MRAPRSRRARGVLAVVVLVVALATLALYLGMEGPDETRVGLVTKVERHRLCIDGEEGELCAQVDAPTAVAGIEVDDCIELRRSADGILESARASNLC